MTQLKLFVAAQTKKEKEYSEVLFEAGRSFANKANKYYKEKTESNYKALIFFHKAYIIIAKL